MMVSVILPVYNAENTISDSIASILDQSFTDFELIIIDDGSTDSSIDIIRKFKDKRIIIYQNKKNLKLIASLNIGLSLAKGKYIIRMDADDIMLKDRIKEQVGYMEFNKQIDASGTYVYTFGEKRNKWGHLPTDNDHILLFGLFDSPIFHPTAIIRKKVLDDNNIVYNCNYPHAEDYKLWLDISKYGKLGNLNKYLLKYRLSSNQITKKYNIAQVETATIIRQELIAEILNRYEIKAPDNFEFSYLYKFINEVRQKKLSKTIDKEFLYSILFIYYMSLNKYSLTSLFHFIKSFVWLKRGFRLKHTVIIILKHFKTTGWKWYSINQHASN